MKRWVALACTAGLLAWLAAPVGDPAEDRCLATRREHAGASHLAVMTFNVRLDSAEADPDNHFTRRVGRLRDAVLRWRPAVVGMQEPFGGQVHDMLRAFGDGHTYRALGYNRPGVEPDDLTHPSRHHDLQCGILYDTSRLTLVDHGYYWLSKTPETEGSKDWGSVGVRTVNVAVFEVKGEDGGGGPQQVAVFNTHLDVWSEEARRGQAGVLRRIVAQYAKKHPHASLFVTGDFNSAPGQSAHRILTRGGEPDTPALADAWEGAPQRNGVGATFHGWLGVSLVNTNLARLGMDLLFTLHGMGFALPPFVPRTPRDMLRAVRAVLSTAPRHSLFEALPSRHHVDWILHSKAAVPVMTCVCEARDGNFSSDHFPVLGVFTLTRGSGAHRVRAGAEG